jgi:hypothetical protein
MIATFGFRATRVAKVRENGESKFATVSSPTIYVTAEGKNPDDCHKNAKGEAAKRCYLVQKFPTVWMLQG